MSLIAPCRDLTNSASSIPFRRTTNGEGRGSPSGRASPRPADVSWPDLPADLGFNGLRLPEARAAQSQMAQERGVEAFVHGHD
jgi:hypothetical protein